jgi:hypothetical protein
MMSVIGILQQLSSLSRSFDPRQGAAPPRILTRVDSERDLVIVHAADDAVAVSTDRGTRAKRLFPGSASSQLKTVHPPISGAPSCLSDRWRNRGRTAAGCWPFRCLCRTR